jgi:outer membrane lipopolysaccharide assembly protein LptE/RlpB
MKKILSKVFMACYLVGMICLVSACNDGLDIQQSYPFTVTTMPVQSKIKVGETAKIRFQLNRLGKYTDTKYFIRYFQVDPKYIVT